MSYVVLIHKEYSQDYLLKVIEKMKELGVPMIRAFYDEFEDVYIAVEGCHRIRAAKALGIEPEWIILDLDEYYDMDVEEPEWSDIDFGGGTTFGDFYNNAARRYAIKL